MDGGEVLQPSELRRLQPPGNLRRYHLAQPVMAGQITETVPGGCYVREADGRAVLRHFLSASTPARPRLPKAGDYWLVLGNGSEALVERSLFELLLVTHLAPRDLVL